MAHNHHATAAPTGAGTSGADVQADASLQMSFYIGHTLQLLFSSWNITSVGGLLGAFAALFFLGVSLEGLRALQGHLLSLSMRGTSSVHTTATSTRERQKVWQWCCPKTRMGRRLVLHLVQSALQVIQVGVAYLLMLAVGTYNVWVFLAVVSGASAGYMGFGWTRYARVGRGRGERSRDKDASSHHSAESDEMVMLPVNEENQ